MNSVYSGGGVNQACMSRFDILLVARINRNVGTEIVHIFQTPVQLYMKPKQLAILIIQSSHSQTD